MNIVKSFSRRTFFWLFFLMLLFCAITVVSIYLGAQYIADFLPLSQLRAAAADVPELSAGMEQLEPLLEWIYILFLPVTFGLFFLFFLVSWLTVRGILIRVLRRTGHEALIKGKTAGAEADEPGKAKKPKKKSEKARFEPPPDTADEQRISAQEIQEGQRRYYLHLLAVLQREGRLVDFLTEDIAPYNDAQIGAAVRSIHENCRKSLEKHLSPRFVMDTDEGEQVTIPVDFDSSTVKLTGNVTGEPPFTGILRHRGWRAGKLELPILTGAGDPKVIAPAEIEIP
jgi:hypothetical protein